MLDYKLLDALARVVQEGGFDKAAQKLNITQSAVSQRIRLLEDATGAVLVSRTCPPVPSPQGKKLLKHHKQVLALEADLRDDMPIPGTRQFRTLALGINADSLATWFYPAVKDFLSSRDLLLDLRVDDQDQTHKLLRDGEVAGCISSEPRPAQGCRVSSLGTMNYRMAASPGFRSAFFPKGFDPGGMESAPAVIYNAKDDLHARFARSCFPKEDFLDFPAHYVPSPEKFLGVILGGQAYGMVPDLQAKPWLENGSLVDLAPDLALGVDLYWHRWNLKSRLLDDFSRAIVKNARIC